MTYSIGVDVGGTKILAGLVDEQGTPVATLREPTPRDDADGALDIVARLVKQLVAESPQPVSGLGLDVPGPCDASGSTVFFAPNLGWSNVPVRAMLAEKVGLPVLVENDGNAAAWGEFRHGAGRDLDGMVMVTVGTGIGGGIIVDDTLIRGAHGAAGEIGHMNVVVNGRPCGCGRNGCWEQYGSGNALVRKARSLAADRRPEAAVLLELGDGTPEGVQGVHVTEAARAGCPVAIDAFTSVGTWLGRGLADLVSILDPEAFVIGGGVCEAGEILLRPMRETLAIKVAGREQRPVPEIRVAELGNHAGLIGVAELARSAA